MADSPKLLPADRLGMALQLLVDWRSGKGQPLACPACGTPGLVIEDRSARPHVEWYALQCRICGLDHVLHIPLAAPAAFLD